jgi:Protein of unknown function (DUF1592)/Protein of unknown function (DUF1588)/Protein of unknown function (DUF1587)/Protein of unknown function (DUF1585)/Protein of unknown function (DUF1595)/Planctomycete cytochrome C
VSYSAGISSLGVLALLVGCTPSHDQLVARHTATIKQYCFECHNDDDKDGGLSLEHHSLADVSADADVWEEVVRKLDSGMMPRSGKRPDAKTYADIIHWLQSELDAGYKPHFPAPGAHRLNRAEYANAIRDLLGVQVDAAQFLPSDDSSRGFDNQAGSLSLSPALLEAYLSAAGKISRTALGDIDTPVQATYRVATDTTQNYHVEGLPFGTRGGLVVSHYFPVDGEYDLKVFSVNLGNMGNFRPFGEVRGEQLQVIVDDEPVAQFDWDKEFGIDRGFGFSGQLKTVDAKLPVKAGPHEIGVTFLATDYAPLLDLNNDFERSTIETGGLPGFTFYPHIGSIRIDGPFAAQGAEHSASRERIFVCRPESAAEEPACARRIVGALARRAFRGQQTDHDIEKLLDFYARGREQGGSFDAGIEMALQRLLVDTKFIYRLEAEPTNVADGDSYPISDLELASRLSFFLLSSIPDDELLTVAEQGKLHEPTVLAEQTKRLLADPRSVAFTKNFAGQWLSLRSLESQQPVVAAFPDFDDNLRQAFRTETELFFKSVLDENRSVTDLLTADYTFVNDRLAKHYGIPGVQGSEFRRVTLGPDLDLRRGLLGKGSVLTISSQPGRTAPVIRGKWVMATLLGVPAPSPPPNVPKLEAKEADAAGNARTPTIREQYEQHRKNPTCHACHSLMDPFGFALEPFDATGHYRTRDGSSPINSVDTMYDGTEVKGPADLRNFVLKYKERYVTNLAEKLLTYALGRGVEYYDMPAVRAIAAAAAKDDYRLGSLVAAVTLSDAFRLNTRGGPAVSHEAPKAAATVAAAQEAR